MPHPRIIQVKEDQFPATDKLDDLIQWLKDCLEEVPDEYKEEVIVNYSDSHGYDIYYYLPETKEEEVARLAKAKYAQEIYERLTVDTRREQYKTLKAEAQEKGWDNE